MAASACGVTGFPFNAIPGREWTHPKRGYYTDEQGRASLAMSLGPHAVLFYQDDQPTNIETQMDVS
jgi:hypothetical protein